MFTVSFYFRIILSNNSTNLISTCLYTVIAIQINKATSLLLYEYIIRYEISVAVTTRVQVIVSSYDFIDSIIKFNDYTKCIWYLPDVVGKGATVCATFSPLKGIPMTPSAMTL